MLDIQRKYIARSLKSKYKQNPKAFWNTFILIGLVFFLAQSYIAAPRTLQALAWDAFLPIVVSASGIILFSFPKNKNLLAFGLGYLCLTAITYATDIFPKPYGTFFFLVSVWLLVDYNNYRILKRSLFSEFISGNYFLAFGIFLSTFIFGLLTEIVNIPFMIWEYNIPIPSLNSFGVPPLMAAFGWTPWTMSILAIFYPFTLKDS